MTRSDLIILFFQGSFSGITMCSNTQGFPFSLPVILAMWMTFCLRVTAWLPPFPILYTSSWRRYISRDGWVPICVPSHKWGRYLQKLQSEISFTSHIQYYIHHSEGNGHTIIDIHLVGLEVVVFLEFRGGWLATKIRVLSADIMWRGRDSSWQPLHLSQN